MSQHSGFWTLPQSLTIGSLIAGSIVALAVLAPAVAPYDPGRPCEIEIEFISPDRLLEYRNRRGVEQRDAMTLVSREDDWWTAWSQFFF